MSVRRTRAPRCLPSNQIQKPCEATRISDGDRGDERRERRQGQKSSPPRKIVIYRTIRMGLGPDASNARIAVPAVQSDRRSKQSVPNQRQRRGGDKTKNRRHRENREIFYDSHGSWYRHRQLECRGFSRAVRSKFQERRLAGAETSPKSPRSHFNWRFLTIVTLQAAKS